MRQRNYMGRRVVKRKQRQLLVATILIILMAIAFGIWKGREIYFKTHFRPNTNIQGVDCSYLKVEEAADAISDAIKQQKITLIFKDTRYELSGEELGMGLKDEKEISAILESQQQSNTSTVKSQQQSNVSKVKSQQRNNTKNAENKYQSENRTYTLENSITVSKNVTRKCLRNIKELQSRNMVEPVDAHIKVCDDGTLAIESEVLGSKIDFEEALSLCIEGIINGDTTINFKKIIKAPQVLSTDIELNQTVDSVNSILNTVINFELADGSIHTLNKEITKTWVTTDEAGNYYVDMNNVDSFVQELKKKAKQAFRIDTFIPTDMTTPIALPGELKFEIEVDAEKVETQIIQDLLASGTYNHKPIYKDGFSPEELLSYIEVDITRQMVWVYINGECVLTTPCVTGRPPNHDTPTGVYYLTYKTRGKDGKGVPLRGYNDDGTRYESWVSFWMPFNGGIGFHDANWQRQFGGDWYLTHGSHGCVNLPYESAQTLYSYINSNIPIIVYCS